MAIVCVVRAGIRFLGTCGVAIQRGMRWSTGGVWSGVLRTCYREDPGDGRAQTQEGRRGPVVRTSKGREGGGVSAKW